VVIAIIAILAALLLPSLSIAKERAITISCLGNLRQVGVANEVYCSDSDYLAPAIVAGRGNRFTPNKSRFDYNTSYFAGGNLFAVAGDPFFNDSQCKEVGGSTVISALTASGTMPAMYADTLIDGAYGNEAMFRCPHPRVSSSYATDRILGYGALFTLSNYSWSNVWGEFPGMKYDPNDGCWGRLRRNGICDPWKKGLLTRPSEGVWYADSTNNGHILLYPFESVYPGTAAYAHHNGHVYINLVFFDGHVASRSKLKSPYMFRLRDSANQDQVYSPYVDDSNRTDPDGLWRAWLKSYPINSALCTSQ